MIGDEVLTPDSSRFWPADLGARRSAALLRKQYVRDWLTSCAWTASRPPPELPSSVVEGHPRALRQPRTSSSPAGAFG